MQTETERRYLAIDDTQLEVRDGDKPVIRGIAPPWDSWSVDLGGFKERFTKGAFDKVLAKRNLDVMMLFNHDERDIMARTTNGTLRISSGEKGLEYEGDPVDVPISQTVLTLIRTKTIFGSSFAFTVDPKHDDWQEVAGGRMERTIREASGLYDVSPVTRAAYPKSSVSARSLAMFREARGIAVAGEKPLLVCIDLETIDAAPGLWRSFILDAHQRGNRIAVTAAGPSTDDATAALRSIGLELDAATVLTYQGAVTRRSVLAHAGLTADVWIDGGKAIAANTGAPVRATSDLGRQARAAAALARMRSQL